jgi:hypothetical protein
LGFDPADGPIDAFSLHPTFHTGKDGKLFVSMVAELVQTKRVSFGDSGSGTFPMRNGATLLIEQDPPKGGERPQPRIRFVIPKLHGRVRRERVKNYYVACGKSISTRQGPHEKDDGRFHLDFGLLHAGL